MDLSGPLQHPLSGRLRDIWAEFIPPMFKAEVGGKGAAAAMTIMGRARLKSCAWLRSLSIYWTKTGFWTAGSTAGLLSLRHRAGLRRSVHRLLPHDNHLLVQ